MHMLAKLFLIGASATVIHAQQGHWDINMPDARIKFCKEKDLGGKCYTEPLQNGVCKLIPDSNATGDKGSSYGISNAPDVVFCQLYLDNACEILGPSKLDKKGQCGYPTWNNGVCNNYDKDIVYRSYRCWPN